MNLNSENFVKSFIDVNKRLNKFVKEIFNDKRVKRYKIVGLGDNLFLPHDICIDVEYISETGSHEMSILVSPKELIKSDIKNRISIYKNQIK
ncbi:MAG: hypothetical protein J1F35_08575 [Erysipelotrichales bacterium]|nr:hypothetical protein [Erysipelotrichales bacterium]